MWVIIISTRATVSSRLNNTVFLLPLHSSLSVCHAHCHLHCIGNNNSIIPEATPIPLNYASSSFLPLVIHALLVTAVQGYRLPEPRPIPLPNPCDTNTAAVSSPSSSYYYYYTWSPAPFLPTTSPLLPPSFLLSFFHIGLVIHTVQITTVLYQKKSQVHPTHLGLHLLLQFLLVTRSV